MSKVQNFIPKSIRLEILNKSDGRCWYCGIPLESSKLYHSSLSAFTVDHFENNGGDQLSNLVPACKDCNNRKKERTVEEFRVSQAIRFGMVFTESQRMYWESKKISLPKDEVYKFYFEKV